MAANGLETTDIEDINMKGMGTKIVASDNKEEKGWMILTNRVWERHYQSRRIKRIRTDKKAETNSRNFLVDKILCSWKKNLLG